jgi:hypothetical protein
MKSNKADEPKQTKTTRRRGYRLFHFQPMSASAGGAPIEKIGNYDKDQPYTRTLNTTLQDERLGARALSLLAYLLSMPPNWQPHYRQLAKRFKCGEWAIRAAMRELVEARYARRRVMRSPDGKHAAGTIWDIRESPEIPWQNKPKTRPIKNLKFRKPEVQETCTHNNDVLMTNKTLKNNDDGIALGNSIPATRSNVSSPSVLNVVEDHQHHHDKPARDHIKWPEFAKWCASRKGHPVKGGRGRVHDGLPTEDGFWKWLNKQKPYWRDKVKPRDHTDGYLLDDKFYTREAFNEFAKENPKVLEEWKFHPAVRYRDGRIVVTNPT